MKPSLRRALTRRFQFEVPPTKTVAHPDNFNAGLAEKSSKVVSV
jgi:hypothetical protein